MHNEKIAANIFNHMTDQFSAQPPAKTAAGLIEKGN